MRDIDVVVVELDEIPNGYAIQDELDRKTGQRTVPSVCWRTTRWRKRTLSSVGPVSLLISGTVPCLGAYWRLTGTSVALLPLALRAMGSSSSNNNNNNNNEFRLPFTWASCLTALMGVVGYVSIGLGFGLAMSHTSIGNVLIFANSQSILLLLGKVVCGNTALHFVEGLGVVVAVCGAILCSQDSDRVARQDGAYDPFQTLWGDGLALIAGIGGVVYLVSANALRDKVDILVYMPVNMFVGSFLVLLFMTVALQQHVTPSRNPHHGLFGWLNPQVDRLWLELYIIFGCSILGTIGYTQAMKHLDNLTVSFACLLEPMIATGIAYFCGVGSLPGLEGWIGNILVVAGTVAVIYPTVEAAKQDRGQP